MRVTLPKPQPLLFSIFCGFEIIDRLILSEPATLKKYGDDNDDGDDAGDTNDNDSTTMMTLIMVIQMMM